MSSFEQFKVSLGDRLASSRPSEAIKARFGSGTQIENSASTHSYLRNPPERNHLNFKHGRYSGSLTSSAKLELSESGQELIARERKNVQARGELKDKTFGSIVDKLIGMNDKTTDKKPLWKIEKVWESPLSTQLGSQNNRSSSNQRDKFNQLEDSCRALSAFREVERNEYPKYPKEDTRELGTECEILKERIRVVEQKNTSIIDKLNYLESERQQHNHMQYFQQNKRKGSVDTAIQKQTKKAVTEVKTNKLKTPTVSQFDLGQLETNNTRFKIILKQIEKQYSSKLKQMESTISDSNEKISFLENKITPLLVKVQEKERFKESEEILKDLKQLIKNNEAEDFHLFSQRDQYLCILEVIKQQQIKQEAMLLEAKRTEEGLLLELMKKNNIIDVLEEEKNKVYQESMLIRRNYDILKEHNTLEANENKEEQEWRHIQEIQKIENKHRVILEKSSQKRKEQQEKCKDMNEKLLDVQGQLSQVEEKYKNEISRKEEIHRKIQDLEGALVEKTKEKDVLAEELEGIRKCLKSLDIMQIIPQELRNQHMKTYEYVEIIKENVVKMKSQYEEMDVEIKRLGRERADLAANVNQLTRKLKEKDGELNQQIHEQKRIIENKKELILRIEQLEIKERQNQEDIIALQEEIKVESQLKAQAETDLEVQSLFVAELTQKLETNYITISELEHGRKVESTQVAYQLQTAKLESQKAHEQVELLKRQIDQIVQDNEDQILLEEELRSKEQKMLKDEINQLRNQIFAAEEAENTQLNQRKQNEERMLREIKELKQQSYKNLREQEDIFQRQIQTLNSEIDRLKENQEVDNQQKLKEQQRMEEEINGLNEQNRERDRQIERITQDNNVLSEKTQSLSLKIKNINEESALQRSSIEQLQSNCSKLTEDNKRLKNENEQIRNKNSVLLEDNQLNIENALKYKDALEKLNQEKKNLLDENHNLNLKITEFNGQITIINNQNDNIILLKKEMEGLREQIEELNKEQINYVQENECLTMHLENANNNLALIHQQFIIQQQKETEFDIKCEQIQEKFTQITQNQQTGDNFNDSQEEQQGTKDQDDKANIITDIEHNDESTNINSQNICQEQRAKDMPRIINQSPQQSLRDEMKALEDENQETYYEEEEVF